MSWERPRKRRPPAECHPDRPHAGRGLCKSCYNAWRAARLRAADGIRDAIAHACELVEYWTEIAVRSETGTIEEWQAISLANEWETRVGRLRAELDALEKQAADASPLHESERPRDQRGLSCKAEWNT